MTAESKLITWIQNVLSTTPVRWNGLVQSLPFELLSQRPAQKEWSAIECLQHLVDVEAVFTFRLLAFLDGRDFPAFDPDSQGTSPVVPPSPAELAQEFERMRGQNLETLAKLTADDLERRSRHAELGPVTLAEMLNNWAAHDLNHTVQAERALMQPFIRDCGPWQSYFTDHRIDG